MNNLGITKIELLIVGLIVGLLGITAVVAISNSKSQTRDAVRLSDVRQLQVSLELFFNEMNNYPPVNEFTALGQPATRCLNQEGFSGTCVKSDTSVYLNPVPITPEAGLKELSSCGKSKNAYCYVSDGEDYRLQFELENNNSFLGLSKGVNCASATRVVSGACENVVKSLEQQ